MHVGSDCVTVHVQHVVFAHETCARETLALKSGFLQRNQLSIGIHRYAAELGDIPEADRSEEERLVKELQNMIDEGQFTDGHVRVDLFTAASVQNGRFPIKRKRAMRSQKEDCWVLIAEERAEGVIDDAGKHDLWMQCVQDLVKVQWMSAAAGVRKELKLVLGDGQLLSIVDTRFGNTTYNEGKWETEEDSTEADVEVVPSLLRPDMHGEAVHKPNMISPLRCAVCTCLEISLPELNEVLYVPCMKIGKHG